MDSFASLAKTKCHRLVGLNNKNLVSHSSGCWKSQTQVRAALHFLGPLSCLADGHLRASSHGLSPVRACGETCGVSSSSYKDTGPVELGPTSRTSFTLNYLLFK